MSQRVQCSVRSEYVIRAKPIASDLHKHVDLYTASTEQLELVTWEVQGTVRIEQAVRASHTGHDVWTGHNSR